MTSATPPLLEVRNLTKTYPGVRAVDDVSLAISPGEVIGLVGKNGAGKSSVIKILAGAVPPDEGEILVDGNPVSIPSPHVATRLGLSVVHQELSVVPDLSVAENVELGLGYPKKAGILVDFRELRLRAATFLEALHPGIDPSRAIGTLPVAQQRVCMVARALASDAQLVVLDEPTASLTSEEIDHLHEVVRGLSRDGVAVIYVSHRLDEIFEISDRVVVMRDGCIVADRPTSTFDRVSLIEEITGSEASSTSVARRRTHGIGGPPDGPEVLRVEGLSVPGHVADISFAVSRGEILGLAGLIGAGRTELVRAVFGADSRSSGVIHVNGEQCHIRSPQDALRTGVVLLPEDRRQQGIILDFNVRENITLGTLDRHRWARFLPFPRNADEVAATRHAIQSLDIKATSHRVPAAWLSGGNQQKLVLGRWMEHEAHVFIFDEPTHGIDVGAKEEIYVLVEQLAADGKAVIFISSEFPELVGICHRVLVMREGRLVGEVAGDEITERRLLEGCYGTDAA